ncbi:multiple coagulation factor deficiency protein 2 homolog [Littorina saxatilis]|uniref:multiple coagulation factor deficiency protein 2 homolog n=1 Tax=Littorina saxatilis TaxID=31220 RepID=UPI0038B59AD3
MFTTLQVILVTISTLLGATSGHGSHGNENVMNMNQQPTSFHDPSVVGDQAHMREHLKEEIGNVNKEMSPEEMEFHYFRLHDSDNDTRLDGLEILKALSHMIPPGMEIMPHEVQGKTPPEIEQLKKERTKQMLTSLVMIIDKVLETDDVDKDGYLTYPEYIVARRRDNKQMMKHQQEMLRQAEAYRQQQAAMNQQKMQMTKTEI